MTLDSPFQFTISMNVLNHLGINLYSNVPAVLAEVVANAWDADAEVVEITIDVDEDTIQITDNGNGMSRSDINNKYLTVGYQRRAKGGSTTQHLKRQVMGRKGIGKLSLFSIARLITVYSVRDGEKSGFQLDVEEIKDAIRQEGEGVASQSAVVPSAPEAGFAPPTAKETQGSTEKKGEGRAIYRPKVVPVDTVDIAKGTRIILKGLSKRLNRTEDALRKRLARRFSVIGAVNKFEIILNTKPITVSDREYISKVECLWTYGPSGNAAKEQCKDLQLSEPGTSKIAESPYEIDGWIGTVPEVAALREGEDSLNHIVLMIRGKAAQEDILDSLGLTGIFTKYIAGEIHADFLDTDSEADIATSSRQSIVEDDPRYIALKKHLKLELAKIRLAWNGYRDKSGVDIAQKIPAVKKWLQDLSPDSRRRAERLFGKINQLPMESESNRRTLIKHAVLAFESFNYKKNLDALEQLEPEDIEALEPIFASLDDIEATLYHQIVHERLSVIGTLRAKIDEDALEAVVQKFLFDHLWLLDPSWERATGTEYMEQEAHKEFAKLDAKLTDDEKQGRLDIKYATTSGKHVIVELKRAGRVLSTTDLIQQVDKYRNALKKLLRTHRPGGHDRVEVVCVVGQGLSDWSDGDARQESEGMLSAKNVRVLMYQELIENAYKAYRDYFEQSHKAGRVLGLIKAIDATDDPDAA